MEAQKTITLGENLKRIRKELGLRQHEIVGEEVTRNLISMIENDKSPVNYRTAQIVADNMNKVCKERGLDVYIASHDIMNPERIDAKKQAQKYIHKLEEHLDNKDYDLDQNFIHEITEFLNEWKIPEKKVKIYDLLADISYFNKDSQREYIYLTKALENYYLTPVKQDIYAIGLKLLSSCIDNKRYEEGLEFLKLRIMKNDYIPNRTKANIRYNEIVIYKRLKNYDKALELIDKYEEFLEEHSLNAFRKALVVKGTCYHAKKENHKAVNLYKKIIEKFGEDSEVSGLAFCNIINNYRILGLKSEISYYRDKLLSLLSKYQKEDNEYLVDIHTKLGKMYEYLGEIESAEFHYICAVNKAVDRKDDDECARILFILLNLYSKTNQKEKIISSNNIFKKGFQNLSITNEMKLAFNLILTNLEIGKKEIASSIITDIIKEDINNEN